MSKEWHSSSSEAIEGRWSKVAECLSKAKNVRFATAGIEQRAILRWDA